MTADDRSVPTAWLSLAATLLLMIVLPAALLYWSPSVWCYFLLGAASWAPAVAAKLLLSQFAPVRRLVRSGFSGAVVWGLFSAASELGLAAAVIAMWQRDASIPEVLALGVGVASAEILYVLGAALREHLRGQDPQTIEAWIAGARQSLWVRNMLFIERLAATLGHVATRGLIYYAIVGGRIWIAAVALVSFTIVDGVAVYGRARDWNWCKPRVARRYYTLCLLVAVAETALLAAVMMSV